MTAPMTPALTEADLAAADSLAGLIPGGDVGGVSLVQLVRIMALCRVAIPQLTAAVRERDAEIARYRAGKMRVATAHEHDLAQAHAAAVDETLSLTRINGDLHAEIARLRDALKEIGVEGMSYAANVARGALEHSIVECAVCKIVLYDDAARIGYCINHEPKTGRP